MLFILLIVVLFAYAYFGARYLPHLITTKSIPSTKPTTINTQHSLALEQQKEKEDNNSITTETSVSSNQLNSIHSNQYEREDLVKKSVERIQSRSTVSLNELPLSNSKLVITELLKSPLNSSQDNGNHLKHLAVLMLASLSLPLKAPFVELLTNSLRVSQKGLLYEFILSVTSTLSDPHNYLLTLLPNEESKRLALGTSNITPSFETTNTDERENNERMEVSILENLNRLQAELWIAYPSSRNNTTNSPTTPSMSPTSSTDIANSSSKRSSFTSDSTTSSNGDSDDTWSSNSTNTTLTTTVSQYKFNFLLIGDLHERRLNPFDASLDDVIKFKSDFVNIRSKIEFIVSNQPSNYSSAWSTQINHALELLANNCNRLDDVLKEFESGFMFVQLCKLIACCVKETRACFSKLADTVLIKREDLDELENWVFNSMHLVECVSKAFKNSNIAQDGELKKIYKAELNEITFVCHEALDQFKQIYSVWTKVVDIKIAISEGTEMLENIEMGDDQLSICYTQSLSTIRDIRGKLFDVVSQDLQVLVNDVVYGIEDTNRTGLAFYEKIKSNLVYSVFYQLQTFKNDMLASTLILEKYDSKQKLKKNIDIGKLWLEAYKANLVAFALAECTWNPLTSPTIRREGLTELRDQYNKFTLTQYDTICDYFPRYSGSVISQCYTKKNITFNAYKTHGLNYQQLGDDVHLLEEYQWFQAFQGECDGVAEVLKFISQIQQQQSNILTFIEHIDQFERKLDTGGYFDEKKAEKIYKDEFKSIQWPTALKYGPVEMGHEFYFYSQSLYLQVSKIKIDFIAVCQEALFASSFSLRKR
jgi:hypothetical protein